MGVSEKAGRDGEGNCAQHFRHVGAVLCAAQWQYRSKGQKRAFFNAGRTLRQQVHLPAIFRSLLPGGAYRMDANVHD